MRYLAYMTRPYHFAIKGFHICHVCFLWQDLSDGTMNLEHMTLTDCTIKACDLDFDLDFEKFNSVYNFLTIRQRAFIFGMCVPYDKTFLMVT